METMPIIAPHSAPQPPKNKWSYTFRFFGAFALTLAKTLGVGAGITIILALANLAVEENKINSCNVSVRMLHGEIATYAYDGGETDSETLVRSLQRDDDDDEIKAVILDIDSPGGSPVAGEEIALQLARLTKPNIAVVRGVGASAAYWAATGADKIYASRSSDVGSIGVAVSFPDESEKNEKEGVAYNEFASGVFKNLGTPNRPVTKAEKTLLERDIEDVFMHFIEVVAMNRRMSTGTVRALADGSTMTGSRALSAGLIDAIGGIEDARKDIEAQIGEEVVLCEPEQQFFF